MRKYSLTFQVGGVKTGYRCTVEVRAANKKNAAIRIRNRIRKMPDVVEPPKFHYTEVVAGVEDMPSEGHDDVNFNKRNRPAPLRNKPNPILPKRDTK